MTLTPEQQSALDALIDFISSRANVFILRGYAGTGKTTLLKSLLDHLKSTREHRPYTLFAPTGRAAKVLQDKTGMGSTIHKGIYAKANEHINYAEDANFDLSVDPENQDIKLIFKLVTRLKNSKPIVIVDEASMISAKTNKEDRFQFGSDNLLEDLIEFSGLDNGGQIIFIGDDAQLPPVTDSFSAALSEEFFISKGLSVRTAKLTHVMRQGTGNIILENAMAIRDNIFKDRKDRFGATMKRADDEFSDITPDVAIIKCASEWKNTIMITHANASAAKFNSAIRKIRFPEHAEPVPGDRLLVVRNAYDIHTKDIADGINMFNGEFCDLLEICEEETRFAFVGENRVELRFRDAKIRHESGMVLSIKIISNILDSPSPNLSELESKALFSEFVSRHQHLRRKEYRDQFLAALHRDPYFNAIQVKYGYAITCHKAQGGEWDNVIVDFTGRSGLDTESLRWAYTAITRASHHLMRANYLSASPLAKLEFLKIKTVHTVDPECHANENNDIPASTPFHTAEAPECKRRKFASVAKLLRPEESIEKVESREWQETYFIKVGSNTIRFDTTHNKKGAFRSFTLSSPATAEATDLLLRLNTTPKPESRIDYSPSSSSLEYLKNIVTECASQCNLLITNIVEHTDQYFVNYYFFSAGTYHRIQFYFNEKGNISTAIPSSFTENTDEAFSSLIKMISNCK